MERQPRILVPALRTPRSAAVAGVLFALLYGLAIVLVRTSLPGGIAEHSDLLAQRSMTRVATATHLVSYAGIAFLWFMGVVRTHIGARENRFLSTVFVGSGFLFLAMTFAAAALTSGLLGAQDATARADGFALGSRVAADLTNLYGLHMAAVFMCSLATLSLRTGALPRAFVWPTYALASVLLLSMGYTKWVALLFPLWVLALSVYLLVRGIAVQPGDA